MFNVGWRALHQHYYEMERREKNAIVKNKCTTPGSISEVKSNVIIQSDIRVMHQAYGAYRKEKT